MVISHHALFFIALGCMVLGVLFSLFRQFQRASMSRRLLMLISFVAVSCMFFSVVLPRAKPSTRLSFRHFSYALKRLGREAAAPKYKIEASSPGSQTFKSVGRMIGDLAPPPAPTPGPVTAAKQSQPSQTAMRPFTYCRVSPDRVQAITSEEALRLAAEAQAVLRAPDREIETAVSAAREARMWNVIPARDMRACARERLVLLVGTFFNDTRRSLLQTIGAAGPEAAPLTEAITSLLILGRIGSGDLQSQDLAAMKCGGPDCRPWKIDECTKKSYGMPVKYVGARCALDVTGGYREPCDGPEHAESERVAAWRAAILQIGGRAVENAAHLVSHPLPQLRSFALSVIAQSKLNHLETAAAVRTLLRDRFIWVRLDALVALRQLVSETEYAYHAKDAASLIEAKQCFRNQMFAEQLARIGPAALPLLIDAVEGRTTAESCSVAQALDRVEFIPPEMEDLLVSKIEQFNSPHAYEPCVHQGLIRALGRIRPPSARIIGVLGSEMFAEKEPSCKFHDIPRSAVFFRRIPTELKYSCV